MRTPIVLIALTLAVAIAAAAIGTLRAHGQAATVIAMETVR